jgi:hypothetical protein
MAKSKIFTFNPSYAADEVSLKNACTVVCQMGRVWFSQPAKKNGRSVERREE